MAQRYSGGGGGFRTTPGERLDLFGLVERRHARQSKLQLELDKVFASHQQELEEKTLQLQKKLAEELRNNVTVMDAARAKGTPIDQFVKEIVPGNILNAQEENKNALQIEKMKGQSLLNPNAQKASDVNVSRELSGFPPASFSQITPFGSVGTTPDVPGVPMRVTKGGTQSNTSTTAGGIVDPKTGIRYGERPVIISRTTPGSSTREITQDEVNAIPAPVQTTPSSANFEQPNLNNLFMPSNPMMDPSNIMGLQPPSQAPGVMAPSSFATTPQGPNDALSGMGANPRGNIMKQLLQLIMENSFAPYNRSMIGQ
jgi:hypothetical protein